MFKSLKKLWETIRRLSGDDAYEQYVLHYQQHYTELIDAQHQQPLLSRAAFFKQWQEKKWTGVKRCC